MGKITNHMRESIAEAAVKATFDPKLSALKAEEHDLAIEAFNELFTKPERDAASKLPDYWLRKDACLDFNVGGQRIRLNLIGEGVRVPYKGKGQSSGGYGCNLLGAILPGDLCERIQKHAQGLETYKDDRRTASRVIISMLSAVTTTKRLRETWPEGLPFYAAYDRDDAPSLPAVRVDEVNEILGLSKAA